MTPSEAAWLHAARRLDRKALAQIYDAYSPELYRYAMRLLGDPMRAEDIVSETFSRFLRALHGGGGPTDHLRAYLYRVAHNAAVDIFRLEDPVEMRQDVEMGVGHLPEEAVEWADQSASVRQALWRLTPDQRQVIVLKFFQGLKNADVSEVLGKPEGAVKSLQHRALDALERLLTAGEEV